MASLQLVFGDGLDGGLAVVQVDGREVDRVEHLTTKLLVGYAGSRTISVPESASEIEVALPRKNLSASVSLPSPLPPALTASVRDGHLSLTFADEPLGYL